MPQIKLTLENEDGSSQSLRFDLPGDLNNLDGIDEAVEQFKRAALPEVVNVGLKLVLPHFW